MEDNSICPKISYSERFVGILLPVLLLLADYLAVIFAEEAAYILRRFVLFGGEGLKLRWFNFWIVFPFIYLIFINSEKLYSTRLQFWQMTQSLFRASLYSISAVMIETYIVQGRNTTSRLFMLIFGVFSFMSLVGMRYCIKMILHHFSVLGVPVLIVGAGKTSEILIRGITKEKGLGYRVIGLLEDGEIKSDFLKKYPILGGFDDLENVINKTKVKHVIIAAPGVDPYKLGALIYKAQPLVENVGVVPNLIGMPMGGLEVESLFNEKLMILKVKNNLSSFSNRVLKIVFDYTLTIVGTICILPILAIIAVWIYKDSPGPIIFKHVRIGKDGKPFGCYKFRSMCVDAKEKLEKLLAKDPEARAEWERDFKLKDDPRITKSGNFLRRTSLDELPQIFNVLKGEMSLVGPRPIVKEELPRYGEFVRDYLSVKPGITGYWQVNGRSDTTYEERVMMDTWYVQNWSVWLDIMIMWRTVKAVAGGKGAY